MQSSPFVFSFRDAIYGQGFVAMVRVDGWTVMTVEGDGDYWFYGVQPGGVSGGGKNFDEARRKFGDSYRSVLFDVAAEARNFDDFIREASAFLTDVNADTLAEWEALLGGREPAARFGFEVSQVGAQNASPVMNELDQVVSAA